MDHVSPQRQHDADGGFLKRALLLGLALLAAIGFAALGVWQVERLAWKRDLIARVDARVHAPPVGLPAPAEWAGLDRRDYEYRHVRVQGVFLHDRATLVQALTERGAGFWVLTPLRTAQGMVLINRGFVPAEEHSVAGQGEQPAMVTGLMRASEPGGGFLRANDPVAGRWYSRDVAAIAQAHRLGPVAPFFVDADLAPTPHGYPLGGLTVVRFPNNHLVYALTWFGLAVLSAGAALFVLRRPER